jgi:hypothetical protein
MIDLAAIEAADRAWFAAHPYRAFRLRLTEPAELPAGVAVPQGARTVVLRGSGHRQRVGVPSLALRFDSDASCRELIWRLHLAGLTLNGERIGRALARLEGVIAA